jgi:hypothetical protein
VRIATLLLFLAALAGCGVTASSFNPGFAEFSRPRLSGVHPDTSISIGPRLLRLAARHSGEGPEVEALLQELEGVQVQVYQLAPHIDLDALHTDLSRQSGAMLEDEWVQAVAVQEEGSLVRVLVKERDGRILGLAILALEDRELVFVNVMGRIAPDTIAGLARADSPTELLASLGPLR